MSAHHQVTLEWGAAGVRATAADVVVIADADRGPETAELRDSRRARRSCSTRRSRTQT